MNKFELYQKAYGNDPYWKEGYYNKTTDNYITLDDYEQIKNTSPQDIDNYELVYPEIGLQDQRTLWEKKPQYVEESFLYGEVLAGVVLGWSANDSGFQKKLKIEASSYQKLNEKYNFPTANYLAELFVSPDVQGEGIGSSLLRNYIAICKEKGFESIVTRTTTLKNNPQAMFLRNGFVKIYDYPKEDKRSRALYSLLLS